MQNYRLTIDLSDIYRDLIPYSIHLIGYTFPFSLIFIEANDYDDACFIIVDRIIKQILSKSKSIKSRILCRKVKRFIRIDKIEQL
ncbi:MAG: hypothetical protein EBU90_10405 [Proteobacteria bacterium]|nr:hypothetical protein [Pseudomonadota bacterium]NBP14147.1 hypothetical protein [bacterium]